MKIENKILDQLINLHIVSKNHIVPFYPTVRDSKEVSVFRCNKSGVIFLSKNKNDNKKYYLDKEGTTYWSSNNRTDGLKSTFNDDFRRFNQFRHLVLKKQYLDVGTGMGGILDYMKPFASKAFGVEPQKSIRKLLNTNGHKVYESVTEIPSKTNFDIISLFHVFEHLPKPLEMLKDIHDKLIVGGKVIIEVPHANDVLIKTFDLDSFKKFTFWSEHLILHTRYSLEIFMREAGFKNISIKGFQRYPLANHLNWLYRNEPGGHDKLTQFRDKTLEKAYSQLLNNLDQTDTIIALGEK